MHPLDQARLNAHNRFNAIQCNASPKWISRTLAVRVNLVVMNSFELRHLLCLHNNYTYTYIYTYIYLHLYVKLTVILMLKYTYT